jgi:hypothetical protein
MQLSLFRSFRFARAFRSESSQMRASGFIAALAFFAPAQPAANGG